MQGNETVSAVSNILLKTLSPDRAQVRASSPVRDDAGWVDRLGPACGFEIKYPRRVSSNYNHNQSID